MKPEESAKERQSKKRHAESKDEAIDSKMAKYVDSVKVPLEQLSADVKRELVEKKKRIAKKPRGAPLSVKPPSHATPKSPVKDSTTTTSATSASSSCEGASRPSSALGKRPAKSVMSYRGLVPRSAELSREAPAPGCSPVERPASASSVKSDHSVDSHRSLPNLARIPKKSDALYKPKKAAQLRRSPAASPTHQHRSAKVDVKPTSPLAKPATPKPVEVKATPKIVESSFEKEKSPFAPRAIAGKDDKFVRNDRIGWIRSRSTDQRPPIGKVEPMLQHSLVHHNNAAAPTRAHNIEDKYSHLKVAWNPNLLFCRPLMSSSRRRSA